MHVDEHIDWAQRLIAYHDRGDFSAIKGEWILKWPRYRQLARQFGARAVRPLRALVGKRYPDRETLRQALEASSGLCSDTMDETFWHACDMGRARFLEGFGWVLAYREDLREYEQLIAQSKTIQSVLKAKGLHQDSHAQIQAELPPPSTLFPRVAKFSTRILAHVEQEAAKVPENMTWLASSDIIESVFGKYKSFTAKGPLKEIGKLVLAIPVFVCNLSTQLIQEAMETVRMIDVEDWIDKHPGKSMLSRRRQALRAPTSDTQTA
jgi:hypothetical protein